MHLPDGSSGLTLRQQGVVQVLDVVRAQSGDTHGTDGRLDVVDRHLVSVHGDRRQAYGLGRRATLVSTCETVIGCAAADVLRSPETSVTKAVISARSASRLVPCTVLVVWRLRPFGAGYR